MTYTVTWEVSGAPLSEIAQSTSILENDTVSSINTNPGETYTCSVVADDGWDLGVESVVESTVTSCSVLYSYELDVDFYDLENIPDCWSASSFASTFDINATLQTPLSSVYDCLDGHQLYDSGCWQQKDYSVLTNGVSWGAILYNYLSTDITWIHGAVQTVEILRPEVNLHPPVLMTWRAPLSGDCNVDFDFVGIGSRYISNTIQMAVYHEEILIHEEDVTGAISNLSMAIPMVANETLTFVFGTSGPFTYDYSGVSQDGCVCFNRWCNPVCLHAVSDTTRQGLALDLLYF